MNERAPQCSTSWRCTTIFASEYFQVRNRSLATKNVFAGGLRVAAVLENFGGGPSDPGSGGARRIFYYHQDHLGSTNVLTTDDGQVHEHVEYFPDGEVWIERGPRVPVNGYRFTGKFFDEETGLYDFGQRFYDPKTSLWLGVDPLISGDPNSAIGRPMMMSSHAYASNSPTRFIDPDGRDVIDAIWNAFGPPGRRSRAPSGFRNVVRFGLAVRKGSDYTYWRRLVESNTPTAKSMITPLRGNPGQGASPLDLATFKNAYEGKGVLGLHEEISKFDPVYRGLANVFQSAQSGDVDRLGEELGVLGVEIGITLLPFVAGRGARLPAWTQGGPTRGILNTGRAEFELVSGPAGGPPALPFPGRNSTNFFHVEAHAAQIMRLENLTEATLHINRVPCAVGPGCANNLPNMLPEGSRLRVIGPGGYDETFVGLPDPPTYPQ